jgi:two-component system alkaline phosphatase synthesis response regulator PhoP/two-component system response regulator VicR
MTTLRGEKRVLVCDGERHVVRLLQVNLERQGYAVTCAFDCRSALDLLETTEPHDERRFHVAVIDAVLPQGDAYDLVEWIRTHESMKDTWVAVMVPSSDDRKVWEGRPFQPNLYVSKPFNPTDLLP